MSIIYFTIVAVLLYLVSDWILEQFETRAGKRFEHRFPARVSNCSRIQSETRAGKRFEHRSLVFFAILLSLAITTFSLIQQYTGNS